jgi:hypothetical protein
VHTDSHDATSVKCDGCGRPVTLEVRPLGLAQVAWRWFDCPHCRRPNFIKLAGQILRAVKDQPAS